MTRLAFGGFELDPTTGELWKGEDCVHVQEQPLKLLLCLLERPGQLVGRDELQKKVWAGDIHVGFEDGLNAAAWRLRQVLGDSAERPLFIETVPRKGYRFVGKVTPLPGKGPPPTGSFPMPVFRPTSNLRVEAATAPRGMFRPRRLWIAAAMGLGILGAGVVAWAALRARVVPLVVTPLSNVTGDPAVDYFASALSRQVAQDLTGTPGLDVHLLEASSAPRGDRGKGALTLTWTVGREGRGYRITVSLADAEGRSRGDRTFMVLPEDLHRVHKVIAEYVAQQVAGEPAQAAAFRRPTLADEANAGGWATPAGGES